MLAAKRLPIILETTLGTGLEGIVLITVEGAVLSSAFEPGVHHDDIALAAISSSIWNTYLQS
jgi:hypothetical protein